MHSTLKDKKMDFRGVTLDELVLMPTLIVSVPVVGIHNRAGPSRETAKMYVFRLKIYSGT